MFKDLLRDISVYLCNSNNCGNHFLSFSLKKVVSVFMCGVSKLDLTSEVLQVAAGQLLQFCSYFLLGGVPQFCERVEDARKALSRTVR